MPAPIRYTFSLISPFSYLGAETFFRLLDKKKVPVTYRVVSVGDVFLATGGLPPSKRHPSRQAYRLLELQRWKRIRQKVRMNLQPKYFPADDSLAAAIVNAVITEANDPRPMILAFHKIVWEDNGDISDLDTLMKVGAKAGYDMVRLRDSAHSDEMAGLREVHTQEAIDAGIFGVPWYEVRGEDFWGQDSLNQIAQRLED